MPSVVKTSDAARVTVAEGLFALRGLAALVLAAEGETCVRVPEAVGLLGFAVGADGVVEGLVVAGAVAGTPAGSAMWGVVESRFAATPPPAMSAKAVTVETMIVRRRVRRRRPSVSTSSTLIRSAAWKFRRSSNGICGSKSSGMLDLLGRRGIG